ncbi:hypothetical protein [Streptomyces sp. NRRL F-5126]|uniref:hypothetical protein n=1 Tax=Streptomyces sp. NRRL F-5126 TaxID=1463857 RepID=UPI00131C2D2C|nr:hypothetical protein [Streptomyces sp. NRRL F-5126]
MSDIRPGQRTVLLLAAVALVFPLAACSHSSGGSTASGKGAGSGQSARQGWMLKYAACMRKNGIDMPDPNSDGQSVALKPDEQGKTVAAIKVCTGKLGTPPPYTPEEQKEIQQKSYDNALKAAKCFRRNGVDVPDPVKGENLAVPQDAPQDVIKKCGNGTGPIMKAQQ